MRKTLFLSLTLTASLNTALASPLSSLSFAGIDNPPTPSATEVLVAQSKAKDQAKDIIAFGKTFIGTPYVYGGTSPKGFDCSGLVQYVFKQAGFTLPRTSRAQYQALEKVSEPEVGDLVFFSHGKRVNHVGIYVGDDKMLHAPSSGKHVEITSLNKPYWQKRYVGARRILDNPVSESGPSDSVLVIAQAPSPQVEKSQPQTITLR